MEGERGGNCPLAGYCQLAPFHIYTPRSRHTRLTAGYRAKKIRKSAPVGVSAFKINILKRGA